MFSLPCLRVGLPGAPAFASCPPNGSCSDLLGEADPCALLCNAFVLGCPAVGRSFNALEKTSGRSNAPGGIRFLLGLPVGVSAGEIQPLRSCCGVPGVSLTSFAERVWRSGGRTGMASSCLGVLDAIVMVGDQPDGRWLSERKMAMQEGARNDPRRRSERALFNAGRWAWMCDLEVGFPGFVLNTAVSRATPRKFQQPRHQEPG